MKYTLGLDIGITSIGWCAVDEDRLRIEALGVRIFNKAENPKDGSSLAAPRRFARGARRSLRRKAFRMERIRSLLVNEGVLSKAEMDGLYNKPFDTDVWELRAAALDKPVDDESFARILIHLAKRRGYKSNRILESIDTEDKKNENSVVKKAINKKTQIMLSGCYRTVGEMMAKDERFAEHKRNKAGSYENSISREMLEAEVQEIFKAQRSLDNAKAATSLEENYLKLFNSQRPYATMEDLLSKVGRCTFERNEKRAPKASYSFEIFNLYSKMNNLGWYGPNGYKGKPEPEEISRLVNDILLSGELKYSRIRKALSIPDEYRFIGLQYGGAKSPENARYIRAPFLSGLRDKLGDLKYDELTSKDIDNIGFCMTFCKNEDEFNQYLSAKGFKDELVSLLTGKSYHGVCHLSFKALENLIPYLKQGMTYDKACAAAGYDFREPDKSEKKKLLPPIESDQITNPVVYRALAQSRKVINAIIRRYGAPYRVNIELTREMSKPFDERKEILKKQEENKKANEEALDRLRELGLDPRPRDIVKYKLYKEQECKCMYSGKPIDLSRLCEDGYAEVDHIIPYSRCFDDSYANKVLVLCSENRNKGNRIPHEYFGVDEEKWQSMQERVETNKRLSRKKKNNLLRSALTAEDSRKLKERALSDTGYINTFLSNYLRRNLEFSGEGNYKKVITLNGSITAFLRKRWGLVKDRIENDLHHAMDAAIAAVTTDGMIQRASKAAKFEELYRVEASFSDPDPDITIVEERESYGINHRLKFPKPWSEFDKELMMRLSPNPAYELKHCFFSSYEDIDEEDLKPVFVSRMPERKVTGAAHQETVRSIKGIEETGITYVKTALEKIKLDSDGEFAMYGDDPVLYNAIKERLLAFNNDPKKAFAAPLYKPTKSGERGPLVRSVKVMSKTSSYITVRAGKGGAFNESMVRADVFFKERKYYLVPVYVADTATEKLPCQAVTIGKNKDAWESIDDSYEFCFSLYQNDLLKIRTRSGITATYPNKSKQVIEETLGYFQGLDISTGAITLEAHDNSWLARGIGVKTAQIFEKFTVDHLGNCSRVKGEKRLGFQKRNDQQPGKVEHKE